MTTTKKTTAALAKALLAHPNKTEIAQDLTQDLTDRAESLAKDLALKVTIPNQRLAKELAALAPGTRVIILGPHNNSHPRTLNRFLKDHTEVWLAKQLGVSQSYVSLLRKHKRTPRLSLVKKLVKVTEIPYEALVEELVTKKKRRRT